MKQTISTRWLAHPNQGCSLFPQSSCECLFNSATKILVIIRKSFVDPPNYVDYRSFEWLSYSEHAIQSFKNMCLFGIHS